MAFAWVHPAGKDVATAALEAGIATLAVPQGAAKDFERLGKVRLLELTDDAVLEGGKRVGARARIASVDDQAAALARAGKEELLLVDAADWKIIPLENLIAACQGRTTLVAEARSAREAEVFLETLEVGVDGVLLHAASAAEVRALADVLARRSRERLSLVPARVTAVRVVGSGDRVCLDTASILGVGEGVLVGSQSGGLFLVGSEAKESGYVSARPFRVNAGPVHAYAYLPGGRTKYLAELRAGDAVLAVKPDGTTRAVVLGRVKIEHRPLLLVEAEANGRRLATLVQNAETVPLVGPQGPKAATELSPGDEILVRLDDAGRHFGTAIQETIVER